MNIKKKYWEIVLEKSNKKHTLPYIIGAGKILFPNNKLDTIEILLEEIINSEIDESYSMFHCSDIGEYVIFKNKYKDYSIKGLEIKNPKTGNLKLTFGINMEVLGKSFEQIKFKLEERYKSNIFAEKFSFEDRKWDYFTKEQKNKILSFKSI